MRREVRFVRFPGENHELSRSGKPSRRLQCFGYLLDWFAEKLPAPVEPSSQVAS
jgi:dipeptidyl aminopeptidase/acylaminoacyl peptidase